MDGYVINTSANWLHAMKRAIGPGAKIPLKELYDQYGIKHSLNDGEEFITWLKTVKLKDNNKWAIITGNEDATVKVKIENNTLAHNKRRSPDSVSPMVSEKMGIDDIINMPVRKAREVIPTIMDSQLLKYSLQQANQLAGKDSLCKIIRKRIQELSLSL